MDKISALLVRKLRKAARHYNKYDEQNTELMENLLVTCIEELGEIVHPRVLLQLKDTVLLYYFKLWSNYVIEFPEYPQRMEALIQGVSFFLKDPARVKQELAEQQQLSQSNIVEFY